MNQSCIYRISISKKSGDKKTNIEHARLLTGFGIEGDIHSSTPRPVSLLPYESFKKLDHPDLDINPGDFAENITTIGLDFTRLNLGVHLKIGGTALLEIIQIGKECHNECIIKEKVGECIMPDEGVFTRVVKGGEIVPGDSITIVEYFKNCI
ncbi:MAG: MOSC domain-containing protein [candidate division Zixibacteria bacterium]|nr:MOSC domain-containing protein [candidate division Zixibacteria bacterium]